MLSENFTALKTIKLTNTFNEFVELARVYVLAHRKAYFSAAGGECEKKDVRGSKKRPN